LSRKTTEWNPTLSNNSTTGENTAFNENLTKNIDIDSKSDVMQEFLNSDLSSPKSETRTYPAPKKSCRDDNTPTNGHMFEKMEAVAEMYRKQGREFYDEKEYERFDYFIF
jgi:hypothetical protein